METIIDKITIDLITQESIIVILPSKIDINELHYKIEYNPEYDGVALCLDAVNGKEKSIMLTLNEKGINSSALNPSNLFKTANFKVEKIIFSCFRKIDFYFTLKRKKGYKMCE